MKSITYLASLVLILLISSCGETTKVPPTVDEEGNLNWLAMTDLEAIPADQRKKVLVDVYTDWCGWCKKMDKMTFEDEAVKKYLNENFHVVKFNAEQKEPLNFKGKTYKFVAQGRRGANELAAEILNGRLGYPTMVYLDEDLNVIKASPGFKKPDQLIADLESLKG